MRPAHREAVRNGHAGTRRVFADTRWPVPFRELVAQAESCGGSNQPDAHRCGTTTSRRPVRHVSRRHLSPSPVNTERFPKAWDIDPTHHPDLGSAFRLTTVLPCPRPFASSSAASTSCSSDISRIMLSSCEPGTHSESRSHASTRRGVGQRTESMPTTLIARSRKGNTVVSSSVPPRVHRPPHSRRMRAVQSLTTARGRQRYR